MYTTVTRTAEPHAAGLHTRSEVHEGHPGKAQHTGHVTLLVHAEQNPHMLNTAHEQHHSLLDLPCRTTKH